jgi:outer membrane protein TolC
VNEEQTNALIGQSERMLRGAVQLQQLLFSESANANIRIQSHLRRAEEAAKDQVALDVVLDVFDAYFDVLRLKTNVAIQRENLDASRQNLELAQIRVSLGASNRADLYRWESEVAVATQEVIEAHLVLNVGKRALDTLLNGVLDDEFEVRDETIDGDLYRQMTESLIAGQLSDPLSLRRLVDFLSAESRRNYPSKLQLEANVLAVERQHVLNKRRFYLPTLSAGVSLNRTFDRAGAGSEPLPGYSFNDDSWSARMTLALPLFEGTRRWIDLQTSRAQMRQLEYQSDDLDQNLSLAVSAAATDLMAASTNIGFSRVAAENTAKSFELIQDNYRQGTVSIVEVLDAQTAALTAKQGYAVAIYEYLTTLMALENLIGEYSLLATPESDRELRQRFDAFIAEREGKP